jgi:hypothetical protein
MKVLRKLFGRSTPVSRPSVRLSLEELENRTVLSTVAASPDGSVYAIWGSDRGLYRYAPGSGWSSELHNNVTQVAVGGEKLWPVLDVAYADGRITQEYVYTFGGPSQYEIQTIHTPPRNTSVSSYGFTSQPPQVDALAAGPGFDVYYTLGPQKFL